MHEFWWPDTWIIAMVRTKSRIFITDLTGWACNSTQLKQVNRTRGWTGSILFIYPCRSNSAPYLVGGRRDLERADGILFNTESRRGKVQENQRFKLYHWPKLNWASPKDSLNDSDLLTNFLWTNFKINILKYYKEEGCDVVLLFLI